MHRRVYPSLSRPLALSVLLTLWVPITMAQSNVQGQWNTLPYLMPINPVHAALLSNGKVLVVAGSGNCPPSQSGCPSGPPYGPANNSGALLWDPVAGSITQFSLSWDMFCNGMVLLQDGRPLIDSGTIQYDPFHGQPKVAVFDPATNLFTDIQNMAHGRWYPTVLTLGDGRIMAFSGLNETGGTNTAVEFYTVGTGWSQQYTATGRRTSTRGCIFCRTVKSSTPERKRRQSCSIRLQRLGTRTLQLRSTAGTAPTVHPCCSL